MIRDLMGAGHIEATADVLVIGAGTVGLVLATELAARGKRVICLESGGREQEGDTHPLNATEQTGTHYAGADHGRFRCLGGTSTRWGGALIPFQASDMTNAGWPINWEDLTPYVPVVEALFGLPPGRYDDPRLLPNVDFLARLAKWPPFKKRNVYSLLRKKIEAAAGPEIWMNATATRYNVRDGRLVSVKANAIDGSTIHTNAAEVVIAAGAIESTRILLLIEQQNNGCIAGSGLGQGFHDHLSAVVAELEVRDRRALNKIVGFQFAPGGGMRNLRFEIAPESNLRKTQSPCFIHIGFSDTEGGFSAIRDLFRAVQQRQTPSFRLLSKLLSDIPWIIRAIWWRLAHKRLLFPEGSRLELHIVVEQGIVEENSIRLSQNKKDAFGLPLSSIEWNVSATDVCQVVNALKAFEHEWNAGPTANLATIRPKLQSDIRRQMVEGGGIYHPGGSTKLAKSPEFGLVGPNLRVFGLRNVAVCSTSIFPSGGGSNPTMMLILFGLRLVDGLT